MDSRIPDDVKPGGLIPADVLNRIRDTAISDVILQGGQSIRRGRQIVLIPGKVAGVASGTATVLHAKIVEAYGTSAPYTYTANLVTWSGSAWVVGALLSANLVNLCEEGPDGSGVGPLAAASVVTCWLNGNRYECEVNNNCGTY